MLVARYGSHAQGRVGYDVVRVVLAEKQESTMEPFLTGFLQGNKYWGRSVNVLLLCDGDRA